jgi:hypothetical protein
MALFLPIGPWAAFCGLPMACSFLCFQAVEGRPVPKAKVSKIKETNLLFSCHHYNHSYNNIF